MVHNSRVQWQGGSTAAEGKVDDLPMKRKEARIKSLSDYLLLRMDWNVPENTRLSLPVFSLLCVCVRALLCVDTQGVFFFIQQKNKMVAM